MPETIFADIHANPEAPVRRWVKPEVVRIGALGEVAQNGDGRGRPSMPPGQCKKLGLICS